MTINNLLPRNDIALLLAALREIVLSSPEVRARLVAKLADRVELDPAVLAIDRRLRIEDVRVRASGLC